MPGRSSTTRFLGSSTPRSSALASGRAVASRQSEAGGCSNVAIRRLRPATHHRHWRFSPKHTYNNLYCFRAKHSALGEIFHPTAACEIDIDTHPNCAALSFVVAKRLFLPRPGRAWVASRENDGLLRHTEEGHHQGSSSAHPISWYGPLLSADNCRHSFLMPSSY